MEDDDDVDAMERRLARQSQRTRFVGGVAVSLISVLGIAGGMLGLAKGRIVTFVGGLGHFLVRHYTAVLP